MSRWVSRFLKSESPPIYGTGNTDKPGDGGHLSVLSVPPQGTLGKNLENMPEARTDKTDKPHDGGHLSVLSVSSQGILDKNLRNMSAVRTDKTDKPHDGGHLSVLSVPPRGALHKFSLLDDFEERVAIAQYDGHQNPTQAQRIAYQDAFISVLTTLSYEESYEKDWLQERIKAAQEWLTKQGLEQPR